jgi:adenylate cyclase
VRAVSAALKIQEEMALWKQGKGHPRGVPIEARIALNTGEAIVGEIGSERRVDYTVLGNAVNVAAAWRSSSRAPATIVIGPGTFEGVKERFTVGPDGASSP